jgi:hypothetical protein
MNIISVVIIVLIEFNLVIYRLTSLSALLVLLELVALEKEEREMSTVTAINSDVTPAATDGQPALPPDA